MSDIFRDGEGNTNVAVVTQAVIDVGLAGTLFMLFNTVNEIKRELGDIRNRIDNTTLQQTTSIEAVIRRVTAMTRDVDSLKSRMSTISESSSQMTHLPPSNSHHFLDSLVPPND